MGALKRAGDYAKKKTVFYEERCEEQRAAFEERLAEISSEPIVYIDESGVDNRLFRPHARAPKGQKVLSQIPGRKRERCSIIGGLLEGTFLAPFMFEGGCTAEVFNLWLEQIFLPRLAEGTYIVMDNAAFHKGLRTRELIEKAKCKLLFLPTYSPDLNPIEHVWHVLKSKLRKSIQKQKDNFFNIIEEALKNLEKNTSDKM